MDIEQPIKQFLVSAANRMTEYNYAKIAEYYANASPEVQNLMEKMALIIIDYDKAIELGFVKLSKEIAETFNEE